MRAILVSPPGRPGGRPQAPELDQSGPTRIPGGRGALLPGNNSRRAHVRHPARPPAAHPVDPAGRMDLTMAFVGTRSMFERAGFRVVGTTDAVAAGMPRLVVRRDLP